MSAVLIERARRALPEIRYELNAPVVDIVENTKHALTLGLPQATPHETQSTPIAIACGGPSLEHSFEDLKEKHSNGMKVVSVNGSHDWLLERGIRPSAHVMIDSRPFNKRFVENWQPETRYLIASQCHPETFKALEGANVMLFHCISTDEELDILDEHYCLNRWESIYPVSGGSTVSLRTIPLMRMLGFTHMELYGFDSCIMDGKHHAYQQDENEENNVGIVTIDGRDFYCHPWMHSQAKEFLKMVRAIGDKFELIVHGDGLIANILKAAVKLKEEM